MALLLPHLLSPRDPPEVPAGAEPALQRPGRVREPAAGTRTGQGGEDPSLGFIAMGFLRPVGRDLRPQLKFPWPEVTPSGYPAPSTLPGGGEDAGTAGPTRQDQREDVRQAEDIFCEPGEGKLCRARLEVNQSLV